VSALTELVAGWRKEAEALRFTPGTDAGYTLKACADALESALESALAAERGGVDDATMGALDMAAFMFEQKDDETHSGYAMRLRALAQTLTATPRGTTTEGG
jgi:hypothetical protein